MSFFRRAGALIARFFTSTGDPGSPTGEFQLYSKIDGNGDSQLFGESDNGSVYQITPPGGSSGIFVTAGTAVAATLAISPDGTRLYGGDQYGNNIKVLSTAGNNLVATIPTGQPGAMVVTPDNAFVYALMFGSSVWVIDTATNTVFTTIPGINGQAILMAPDGLHVYVLDTFGAQVVVIDTATNTIAATTLCGPTPSAFAITPDGAFVCVTNLSSDEVTVIETTTFAVFTTVSLTQVGPLSVVAAPGSAHIYVGTSDGFITKIATATWTIVGAPLLLAPAVAPVFLRINAANTRLYAYSTNFLQVIDLGTFTVLAQTPDASPALITTFLLSPDGTRLYIPYDDSQLLVIDTSNPTVTLATVPVGSNTIDMVATPDSSKIYLTDGDETLRMILAVDNSVTIVNAAVGPVNTLSFPNAIVTDLGGGVAQIDIGVTQYAFVYQPGGTPGANVYDNWTALCARLSLVAGPKLLQFDDQFMPIVIPSGTWDMTDTVWEGVDKNYESSNGSTLVMFDSGAVVTKLRTIRGLRLDALATPAILDLADGDVFTLDDYAVIGGFDFPVIDLTNVEEAKSVTISVRHGSQVLQQGFPITGLVNDGQLVVDIDKASIFDGNTVDNGLAPNAFLTIRQQAADSFAAIQSYFGGTVRIINSLGGFNLQPDDLYQLNAGIVNYFTLGGAVNSNLMPASWHPGGIFVVKNASSSGTVTINPSGADTIDGNPTHVLTAGQSVIMVSDGVSNFMIIGEKG